MKYLKYPLYIIGALLILFILLCLVGPKKLDMTASTRINATAPIVFNLVNNLEKTALWSHWNLSDSTMISTYNNIAEGVGASSEWKSLSQGNGKQSIIESEKYNRVRSQLEFDGWDGYSYAEFNILEEGDQTDVSWAFESGSPLPFLFRGVALLSGMKGSLRKSYEKGLANLKKLAEERQNSIYMGYQIDELLLPERHFVMQRQKINIESMQEFYKRHLASLFTKVQTAKVEMDGMPCGLFFTWNEELGTTDMAAGIPVADPIVIKGAMSYSIPSRMGLQLDYYGDYSGMSKAHSAMEEFMNDRNYLQDPPVIEEYVTDPGEEEDTEKWRTRVIYYYTSRIVDGG